jgi:hypothetical protein
VGNLLCSLRRSQRIGSSETTASKRTLVKLFGCKLEAAQGRCGMTAGGGRRVFAAYLTFSPRQMICRPLRPPTQ